MRISALREGTIRSTGLDDLLTGANEHFLIRYCDHPTGTIRGETILWGNLLGWEINKNPSDCLMSPVIKSFSPPALKRCRCCKVPSCNKGDINEHSGKKKRGISNCGLATDLRC